MLNFCQWCKTRFSAFSQKFSAMTPNFFACRARGQHKHII